jgi:uncharacterized protein YggE
MRSLAVPVLVLGSLAACASPRALLRVSGEGRAAAKPDLATLAIGVESLAPALPDAVRDADERLRRVAAALEGARIPAEDVRTTRYDVGMERRFDPQRGGPGEITGYRVVHELRVLVRGGEPARAGAALDAALRAGANLVHSVAFEKADLAPERARALEAALAAARLKAEALARAAGRALGPPSAIAEQSGQGPIVPLRMARVAAAEAGTPLQAGELEVTAAVDVEYPLR